MDLLSFERCCDEIVAQSESLASCLEEADLATAVPPCPGWNLAQLVRHLGGAHRWTEETVRTRATGPLPDTRIREVPADPGVDPAVLGAWLVEGARELAKALREAGPDAEVWSPAPGGAPFLARRMAHETVVHRADAALTVGAEYEVDEEIAVDTLDEWMELGAMPQFLEAFPEKRELLGPGRTLHFHATDTSPGAEADWLIDLTGDAIVWRRSQEAAAVTVRGPLTGLLLVVYRRLAARDAGVQVVGDVRLFDFWLERVAFGG